MKREDILALRLTNQQLTQTTFSDPFELVQWFGAVQSQDFSAAKWGVGQRVNHATDEAIEKAFTEGKILRTHVLRPTWHFVHPEDIRWMLQLTAPQIKRLMTYYNRILNLDEALFKKTQAIFIKALQGKKQLTRTELAQALQDHNIDVKGQTLGHIVMWAELDGVICSGPKNGNPSGKAQGKQFTYMLLEERVPKTKELEKDDALALLTKKYFQSHGPATVKDFAWWSGLSMQDAKKGIVLNNSLKKEIGEAKTYYFFETKSLSMPTEIYLLPNYDEYTIAFKERELFYPDPGIEMPKVGLAVPFAHTIIQNGRIIGLYRREVQKDTVILIPKFFKSPTQEEKEGLKNAVEKYGGFLEQKVSVKE